MISINRNPSARDLRWFGLLLLFFFVVLATIARFRFDAPDASIRLAATGLALCAIYYAVAPLRRWIFLGWMYAAFPIGWTISHVLMFVVYYLILTPIGIGLRLGGRDLLDRRFDAAASSYWVRREEAPPATRYFRQF